MTHNLRLRVLPALIPTNGKDAEFRRHGEWLQWRVTDGEWQNLVPLSAIKGDPGQMGPTTQWRVDGAYLQAAPVGSDDWQDIVALADITGPEGGINYRGAWTAQEYAYNSIVEHNGSLWYADKDTEEEPSNTATDWELFMPGSGPADGSVDYAKLAPNVTRGLDFFTFTDVQALQSNTSLQYGNGASQVQAGDILRTRKEGFSYQVLAADAAGAWLLEVGQGVKLLPLSGLTGVSVAQFGEIGTTDDSAAFQKWAAYLNAGLNKLGVIPSGSRYAFTGATFADADVTIMAWGAEVVPSAVGKVFYISGGHFRMHGGTFDLEDFPTSTGDTRAIDSDDAETFELIGVRFLKGRFGAYARTSGRIHIERCFGDGADRWHFVVHGFSSCHMLYNEVINGAYDGLKISGAESGSDVGGGAINCDDLVVIGNVCRNNVRDGLDLATNNARRNIITDNIFTGNGLCGIEYKIVYASQTGISQAIISGNIVEKSAGANDHGISIQNLYGGDQWISDVQVFGNTVHCPDGVVAGNGIRVAGQIRDGWVHDNRVENFNGAIRVQNGAAGTLVEGNTVVGAVNCVQIDDAGNIAIPTGTVVRRNNLSRRVSGPGRCVEVLASNGAEIYENDFDNISSSFTINDGGTGTVIGKNYRGWTSGMPTGRAFLGDTWRERDNSAGAPTEWTCIESNSSMNDARIAGTGQRGMRSGAAPSGSVVSKFRGEQYLQVSGGTRIWTSVGTGTTSWI